jgi:type I restriction enzyme M protein
MITGELKSQVDKLWTEFWTGGITNPLTVIEQITFLMFSRLLDINESRNEKRAQRTGKDFKPLFRGDQQHLRWSRFKQLGGEEMLAVVRDGVFKHFREDVATRSRLGDYMKDAQLMVQKPSLLVSAVNMIEALPLTEGDTKGDLYEYLLSKLTTAGINGQFRTPRHIIRLMVDMLEPKPTEIIGDPACGTGGFLVSVMQYLLETHTSQKGIISHEDGSKTFTGDQIKPEEWDHIRSNMFHGFDFDSTMLRIAAMNLMLHGVDEPDIHYQDTLSNNFPEKFSQQASDCFDVILANPPFKGSLDESDVHPSLVGKVKTKKTELLFLSLILRMLKIGGRSATIVPDGVLFGSSKAHAALRQMLMEENQLEAVISLPSGVFKPYAGVSTAILIFTKGGRTDNVFFYGVENDGYSLDDKRDKIDSDDLPDVIARWQKRDAKKDTDRKGKCFSVPSSEIKATNYDLSFSRYRETVHAEVKYDAPKIILGRLKKLEADIQTDLTDLEAMLG